MRRPTSYPSSDDVEQDEIGGFLANGPKRRFTVEGDAEPIVRAKQVDEHVDVRLRVVDDENSRFAERRHPVGAARRQLSRHGAARLCPHSAQAFMRCLLATMLLIFAWHRRLRL